MNVNEFTGVLYSTENFFFFCTKHINKLYISIFNILTVTKLFPLSTVIDVLSSFASLE